MSTAVWPYLPPAELIREEEATLVSYDFDTKSQTEQLTTLAGPGARMATEFLAGDAGISEERPGRMHCVACTR